MSTQIIESLHRRGFDRSMEDEEEGGCFASCSQCAAVVINGVPCHEHGCPNDTHPCWECDAPVSKCYRLCESCANPDFDEEAF